MIQRTYGTRRPTNFAGGLMRRGVLLLASLLLVCVLMAGAVSAEETNPWKIADTTYENLSLAIAAVSEGQTITLTQDLTGEGVSVPQGKKFILDLNQHTYTVNSGVGSAGTETNGFQLLNGVGKDSDQRTVLTFKNGTIQASETVVDGSKELRILIQNYADLTLDNIILDGSKLTGSKYTLSNNHGEVNLTGTTEIIAHPQGGVAFDVWYCMDPNYDDGVNVTILSPNVKIDGRVEWGPTTVTREKFYANSGIYIPSTYHSLKPAVDSTTSGDVVYSWTKAANKDGYMKLAAGSSVAVIGNAEYMSLSDAVYAAESTDTVKLNSDISATETITITKAVTLDLNGYSIIDGRTISSPDGQTFLIEIKDGADVKIMNSGAAKSITASDSGVNVIQGKITLDSGVTIDAKYAGIYVRGSTVSTDTNYAVVIVNKDAIVTGQYGVVVRGEVTSNHGYGAVLDVSGSLLGKTDSQPESTDGANGIFVSGNLKDTTGNIPQVIIREGAVLSGAVIGEETGQAIAGNGYAKVTISGGTFTGAEALGIKSGEWIISGGTFTANGGFADPYDPNTNGAEKTGAAVSITNTYDGPISVTIQGGEFTSELGYALYNGKSVTSNDPKVKLLEIVGGTFSAKASDKAAIKIYENTLLPEGVQSITGGKYSSSPAAYLSGDYTAVLDGSWWTVTTAAVKPKVNETVTKVGEETKITRTDSGNTTWVDTTNTLTLTTAGQKGQDGSVILNVTYSGSPTVDTSSVQGLVDAVEAFYQNISLEKPDGIQETPKITLSVTLKDVNTSLPDISDQLEQEKKDALTNFGSTYSEFKIGPAFVAMHDNIQAFNSNITSITMTILVPKSWAPDRNRIGAAHISDDATPHVSTTGVSVTVDDAGMNWEVTIISNQGFSGYAVYYGVTSTPPVPPVPPVYSSGDGNMENAYRVLFETSGGSYVSPATGLSAGDKITAPANPVKDGYTFGGWYKDAACTQGWSFSDAIDGDITLYAKWTGGSAAQQTTTATAAPTAKQTTAPEQTQSQGASVTTAAPAATTAAGVSPTLTQAPAPVFGALLGLLAAGVLLRRRN